MIARKRLFPILALIATVLLSTAQAAVAQARPEQDIPPCSGVVLSPDIMDLVNAARKDPAQALEKKRKQGANAITPAVVECASSLWQALNPPAPKMTWAQRRAAARAAEKARIAEASSRKPTLSRALSAAGRRVLSGQEQEDQLKRALVPVVYAGPFNNPKAVAPILAPPLRGVQPIPPPTRAEVQHRIKKKRPPAPVTAGGPNGFRQTFMGPETSAPDPAGVSFDGIGVGLGGFNPSSNPPDVNGGCRRDAIRAMEQQQLCRLQQAPARCSMVLPPATRCFSPSVAFAPRTTTAIPVVNYDRLAGRWVLSQFVVEASPSASHQCVAVSATDDALGAYYLYDFVTDPVNFVDYPHMGVWPDGYYMSSHVFNCRRHRVARGPGPCLRARARCSSASRRGRCRADLSKDGTARSSTAFSPPISTASPRRPRAQASFVLGPEWPVHQSDRLRRAWRSPGA